jgi:SAM-dependent methyltransferase
MSEAPQFYQAPGLNVETYDVLTEQLLGTDPNELKFYLDQAELTGDPVLELGAGTGRVSWALAEAGRAIVGLDLSEPMLRLAEAKRTTVSPSARGRARFVRGDMADFELGGTFSLVIIPYRGFQVLVSPEDQERSLRCIHHHLQEGGRLIIDLFDPRLDWCTPEPSIPSDLTTLRHPVSGNTVKVEKIRLKTDPVTQVLTERWCFSEIDGGGETSRVEEELLTMRWTYRQEMRYLFQLTGFTVESEFSDFRGSPPAYGKEQIWVVRKA